MANAHYIIFHPDGCRKQYKVTADVLINGKLQKNKTLHYVWIDDLNDGGAVDPYVLGSTWLYSYCHASQLRKTANYSEYIGIGSWLYFCSGDSANQDMLIFDTVFLVGHSHPWPGKLIRPSKFDEEKINKSALWDHHFSNPHDSATFTYAGDLWTQGKENYSFLPYTSNMKRVRIPFMDLSYDDLRYKVTKKVKGKHPVRITESQAKYLSELISSKTDIQVIDNISNLQEMKRLEGRFAY